MIKIVRLPRNQIFIAATQTNAVSSVGEKSSLEALVSWRNLLFDVAPNGAGSRLRSVRGTCASGFSTSVFFSAEEMKGNVFFVPDDPAVMPRWNVK